MGFEDGSIGTIHYWSNGSSSFSKERIEVFCQEKIGILDNFKKLQLINNNKIQNKNFYSSDKGFYNECKYFLDTCQGKENFVPIDTLLANSEITFKVLEQLRDI